MTGYVPLNERRRRAHAKLLDAVGSGRRVLDVGCSSGYLARPLAGRGNTIVGIELDPAAARAAEAYCERVLVGDVVEHLRDPVATLARLRQFLKPGGRVVVSTPNVANWAIRLSLLAGRWRYTDRGILDRSHTYLFTRATLAEAIERAGYEIVRSDFTVPVPGDSELLDAVGRAIGRLRPSLFAYQFVVEAVPHTSS